MQDKTTGKKPQLSVTAIGEQPKRPQLPVNAFHRLQPLPPESIFRQPAGPGARLSSLVSHAETRVSELVNAAVWRTQGSNSTELEQHISAVASALYDCYKESQDPATITRLLINLRKSAVTTYIEGETDDLKSRLLAKKFPDMDYPGISGQEGRSVAKTVIALVAKRDADQLVQTVLFSLGSLVVNAEAGAEAGLVDTVRSSLKAMVANEGETTIVHLNDLSLPAVLHLVRTEAA